MPLNLFYTMVQKVKNDQKLKSRGGSCLKHHHAFIEIKLEILAQKKSEEGTFLNLLCRNGKNKALKPSPSQNAGANFHSFWKFTVRKIHT